MTTAPISGWDDLSRLPYETIKQIAQDHERALAGPLSGVKDVAGMHVSRFTSEKQDPRLNLYRALQEMAREGTGSLQLLEEANTQSPLTFSRQRRFHSGTELFQRGEFIEELYIFPSGTVRTFKAISKDKSRIKRLAGVQDFLMGLYLFAKSQPKDGPYKTVIQQQIESFSCRQPLSVNGRSITNLYLNAADLKTVLKHSMSLDERISTILTTSLHDLTLHAYSQRFLQTPEGKVLAQIPRTWRFWQQGTSLFGEYDEALETVEEIIIEADKDLECQLRHARLLTKERKLKNGSAALLYNNPQIAAVLDLLGIGTTASQKAQQKKAPQKAQVGFSMGDLNPANVMVYKNGGQEFVDFEDAKLAPVTSLLFPRWVRSGVYGPTGKPLTIVDQEGVHTAESSLLDACFLYLQALPGDSPPKAAPAKDQFIEGFKRHKLQFLLRLARRYKQYESIDENPDRMRSLKRYYFSWFVNEMIDQGKVAGRQDPTLNYLNNLFEAPLGDDQMSIIFGDENPAFCYRSELSPIDGGVGKRIHDDIESRIKEYRIGKHQRQARKFVCGAIAAALMIGVGSLAKTEISINQDLLRQKAQIEQRKIDLEARKIELESRLKKIDRELAYEKDSRSLERSVQAVRMYHNYRQPMETKEVLERQHLQTWIERFWSWRQEKGAWQWPDNPQVREKYSKEMGRVFTAYAAFIDWPTTKEAIFQSQCADWNCDLGKWIAKKAGEEWDKDKVYIQSLSVSDRDQAFPRALGRHEKLRMALWEATYNGIDSFVHHGDGWRKETENETCFIRKYAFGLGHFCKPSGSPCHADISLR